MLKSAIIKNYKEEVRLFTKRSIVLLCGLFFLFLILILRLVYLQVIEQHLYTTLSAQNQLSLMPLVPKRGLIYDRNGVLLAENVPVFSLDVIPDRVKNIQATLQDIAKIISISDIDLEAFNKQLKTHRRFEHIPLKPKLEEVEVAKLYMEKYRFPGVAVTARLMRYYPFLDSMSNVIGFVGRINEHDLKTIDLANYSATNYIGKTGIEKFYENQLHGKIGYQHVEMNASGRSVRVLKRIPPVGGENLYLSLDSKLQAAAEQALGKESGAVVVIKPDNGEVLVLANSPRFDPNLFVRGISNEDYKKLNTAQNRPLFNRAVRGQFPMASTIKPFIALGALETGSITPEASIYDPGWFQLPNTQHIYHDWKPGGHGTVNLSKAISVSCDIFFFRLTVSMGIENINRILDEFGFGKLSGIDMFEELPGLLASPEWKLKNKGKPWYLGDTVVYGIGQGYVLVTPLQLANAVARIANRGQSFQPHLVISTQKPGGQKVNTLPTPNTTLVLHNTSAWQEVIDAMQGVITYGTGYRFGRDAPYTVAAKTGTAQLYHIHRVGKTEAANEKNIAKKLQDHSLFIAFAPVDKPKIAMAVIVENSMNASSVARKVLDAYFLTLAHQPS